MNAIDVHVHLYTGEKRKQSSASQADAKKVFGGDRPGPTADELADFYRGLDMMAVVFDVDAETRNGIRIANDEIAEAMERYPDVLIGFGSVDPWKGKAAIEELKERSAYEHVIVNDDIQAAVRGILDILGEEGGDPPK